MKAKVRVQRKEGGGWLVIEQTARGWAPIAVCGRHSDAIAMRDARRRQTRKRR
jgi:predicted RNA-binding Zn ribbon-like protein